MDTPERPNSRPVPDPTALTTAALEREIERLKELLEQRLRANRELYEQHFQLQEQYRQEQKVDAGKALDTALISTKTEIGAANTAIADLKDRVSRIENRGLGQLEQRSEHRAGAETNVSYITAVIAGLGFLVSLGVLIFFLAVHH